MDVPAGVFMGYKDIMRVTNIVDRTVWDIQPVFLLFVLFDQMENGTIMLLDDVD